MKKVAEAGRYPRKNSFHVSSYNFRLDAFLTRASLDNVEFKGIAIFTRFRWHALQRISKRPQEKI